MENMGKLGGGKAGGGGGEEEIAGMGHCARRSKHWSLIP